MSKASFLSQTLSVIALVTLTFSGCSTAPPHSQVPGSQQRVQEVQGIAGEDKGWSNWDSVSGVPLQVPQKAISSDFSVSQTTGIEIDNRVYNLKVSNTALGRHTESDMDSLFPLPPEGAPHRDRLKKMLWTGAVCEVFRTESGKADFRPLNAIKKDGAVLSGLGTPATATSYAPRSGHRDLYVTAGTIRLLHGVFFFGQQYVPWWFRKGTNSFTVELKNAVFVTEEAALYGNDTTVIRSRDTGFRIGDCEFQGEAQLSNTGISLLSGTKFRTKEPGGQ